MLCYVHPKYSYPLSPDFTSFDDLYPIWGLQHVTGQVSQGCPQHLRALGYQDSSGPDSQELNGENPEASLPGAHASRIWLNFNKVLLFNVSFNLNNVL